jgi:hypothetical protein
MKRIFHGITRDERKQKFKAHLHIAGKLRNLGYFDTKEEAARMWDSARVRLADYFHKSIPRLNFGYDNLHDPHETEWLREKLKAEGARTFSHQPVEDPNNNDLPAQEPAPLDSSSSAGHNGLGSVELAHAADMRARLLQEATTLTRRLAEVLTALSQ